jgi:hypothetical protein
LEEKPAKWEGVNPSGLFSYDIKNTMYMSAEMSLMGKMSGLPPHLKEELLRYADYLLFTHANQQKNTRKKLKAGFSKISFVMSPDFNEPLDDFKDYM